MKLIKYSLYILVSYFIQCQSNAHSLFTLPAHTITVYEGLDTSTATTIDITHLKEQPISLHFLLPTIGRKSIFKMLNSLEQQVQPQDYVTVIFDGKDQDHVFNKTRKRLAQFPCKTTLIFGKENLGYWGHSIRNKYNFLSGDFVLHCDDDNKYSNNSISAIRKICTDPTKLYLFRIKVNSNVIWSKPRIKRHYIDTANGVIPTQYNTLGIWGLRYGGDFDFYSSLTQKIPTDKITFVDFIIYTKKINPIN